MTSEQLENRMNCRVCQARYNTTGMESGSPFSCRHCGAVLHVPGERKKTAGGHAELPFGQMAVKLGFITAPQLQAMLKKQIGLGAENTRLGDLLLSEGLITSAQVSEILESQGATITHMIPGYEIVEKLGVGGMGAVYKGLHHASQKTVAMKVMVEKLAKRKDFLERFHREAKVAIAMDHPNIVKGFDEGVAGDLHYFVMEYVHGKSTLRIIRKQGPFSELRSMDIIRQMVKALHYANKRKILHRDVKPDNIMIDLQGVAKLADYGLVKHLNESEDAGLTMAGQVMGTPNYISPEQARGEADLDIRSDIYSLGASLYHLLIGNPPFTGASAAVIMGMHVSAPRPQPQEFREDLSDAAAAIVLKMLAIEREDRYQTPKELLHDIERYFKKRPTKAGIETPARMYTPPPKHSQRLRAVAASPEGGLGVLDDEDSGVSEEENLSQSAKILFGVGIVVLVLGLLTAGWFFLRGDGADGNSDQPKITASRMMYDAEAAQGRDRMRILQDLIQRFPKSSEAEEAREIIRKTKAWRQARMMADDRLKAALPMVGTERENALNALVKKYPNQPASDQAREILNQIATARRAAEEKRIADEIAAKRAHEVNSMKAFQTAMKVSDAGVPPPREAALLAVRKKFKGTKGESFAADALNRLREQMKQAAIRAKREKGRQEAEKQEAAKQAERARLEIVIQKYATYYVPAMRKLDHVEAIRYAKKLAQDKRYPALHQLGRNCLADAEALKEILPALRVGLLMSPGREQTILFRDGKTLVGTVATVRDGRLTMYVSGGNVPQTRDLSALADETAAFLIRKGYTKKDPPTGLLLGLHYWTRGNRARAAQMFRTIEDRDPRRKHHQERLLQWDVTRITRDR